MNATPPPSSDKIREYAGAGITHHIDHLPPSPSSATHHKHSFLGEWFSTAICGNDITSSCLYVSGMAVIFAGVLAPVVLLLVGFTLFLFRRIYGEVGSALPMNGGTYTLLLNTTTKKIAAAAAGLTILSYVATAVISASEAIHYIRVLLPMLPSGPAVVGLLAFFSLLSIYGIGESAKVALSIFVLHLLTLTLLIISGLYFIVTEPLILIENLKTGFAEISWAKSLFLGFAVSLLGISGFESSANFIEEQKPGVFPKTLKNMWLAILILNPMIAFLAIGMVPLTKVGDLGEGFLSHLGNLSMGNAFSSWIAINAFLVLSGAVLTSFVGITGLVRRMALDRCMPRILLRENAWRKTNHWIISGFFIVCVSIYMVTQGETKDLAGVYTLSFLSVMSFFAIGNGILKLRRSRLPRAEIAPWSYIFVGLILLVVGIIGNLYLNPFGGFVFFIYYAITLSLILFLLLRTFFLRILLLGIHNSVSLLPHTKDKFLDIILKMIKKITSVPVLYFSKGDTLSSLHQAVLYVVTNEQTHSLTVCHFTHKHGEVVETLAKHSKILDEIYPKLKIDVLIVNSDFTPQAVENLSQHLNIPKNHMFIGSPGGLFPHRIENLGGVRVILSGDGL